MKQIFHILLFLLLVFGKIVAQEDSAVLPQLEFKTYGSQIFWFVVSFSSLFFILKTYFIPKISGIKTKRQQKIILNYSKSEQIRNELVNLERQISFNKKEIKDTIANNHLARKQKKRDLQQEIEQNIASQISAIIEKYNKETGTALKKQRSGIKDNVELILKSLLKDFDLSIDDKKFIYCVDEIIENYNKKI